MKTKFPTASRILSDPQFRDLAELYGALNEGWTPHEGQIEVGEAIFSDGARRIFIENGRKWGKSEFAVDLCWRLGNAIQGGQIYYYGAYAKAVREFIWASQRLQKHGPESYVSDIHKTEMRITFTSGTFVKCDGADEFKISKGFNPDVVILDEFADYDEDFWVAMSPNFASKDTIVIIISSPPWLLESEPGKPVIFCRIADLWAKYQKDAEKKGLNSKYRYYNQPTTKNPHISREWLAEEKQALIDLDLEDVWMREYEAKRVVGGGKRIVGTYFAAQHMKPHDILMQKLDRDKTILVWASIVDPSNSAFGYLCMAVNPYTKEVYFLDEILEKSEDETTEQAISPRIKAIEDELFSDEENSDTERFERVCDEAAKWFIVGCANDPQIGVHWHPTEKHLHTKEFGISLLRTLFRYNKGYVSDRCKWLSWQLENYRKDKKGAIPKLNDDLIDAARYGLHKLGWYLSPDDIPRTSTPHPKIVHLALRRGPEEDLLELGRDLRSHDGLVFHDNMREDKWN